MEEHMKATMTNSQHPRPFLKWVGGKHWLLPTLTKIRPRKFNNYHEPFLGGGAHAFDLLASGFARNSYLSDMNSELVKTYLAVQKSPSLVLDSINRHIACHCEEYFLQLRAMDCAGMPDHEVASRMIYLNRSGFNGLYRVTRKGKLNVSWGHRERIGFDEDNLFRASCALRSAVISQGDFGNVLDNAKTGDFVFFDPPYPNGFDQYTPVGFDDSDQHRLHFVCVELDRRNIRFAQTNSDCPFIRRLYCDFGIIPVQSRRNINCKGNDRGPVGEVIVTNY
jgi:DNA adenine methylase